MTKPFLVDSHAHIQGAEFAPDLSAVLQRAWEVGVGKIVVVGGSGESSGNDAALELARSLSGLFATVGIHPHDAKDASEEHLKKIEELAGGSQVVALGETGLDFHYNHSPRQSQIDLFCRFVRMALETRLPLVVHNREADQEIAAHIRREGQGKVQGVIHCFTSDYEAAREFLDLGFYLSFSGIITFRNAESLREVARKAPLDRILVETDSPYLAPVPYRGKRNEPAFVRLVAETLAQLKGLTLEEVAGATSANTARLFGM